MAHKGHEYIVCAAVWLPLTLHFIHRYAERLRILDLGYAAVPVAFSILAGFPQITLYSTLVAIAYIPFCIAGSPLLRGWKAKLAHIFFGEFVVLGIGSLLGCLPLVSVAESLPYLTRERITYGMFTSDNFPPAQLLTFLIPDLFGGVDRHIPAYAPDTTVFVAEVYAYVGILPLTLALAGVSAWRTACRELKVLVCGRGHRPLDVIRRDDPDLSPVVSPAGLQPVSRAGQEPVRSLPRAERHRCNRPGYPPCAFQGCCRRRHPFARKQSERFSSQCSQPGAPNASSNFRAYGHRGPGRANVSLPGGGLVFPAFHDPGLHSDKLFVHVRHRETGHDQKSVMEQREYDSAADFLHFDRCNSLVSDP